MCLFLATLVAQGLSISILKLNYFKKLFKKTFFLCPDMSRLFIYFPLFPDLFPDLVWVVTGCHWLSRDFPGKGWCYKGPDITVSITFIYFRSIFIKRVNFI